MAKTIRSENVRPIAEFPKCPDCGKQDGWSMEERSTRGTSTLYKIALDGWDYVSGPENVATDDLFEILFGCDECGFQAVEDPLWGVLANWPTDDTTDSREPGR